MNINTDAIDEVALALLYLTCMTDTAHGRVSTGMC
ncbi:hypothetical protein QF001_000360 [Paraburkholderia youngii]